MLHTISAFDRLGEENAFAVLARATALAPARARTSSISASASRTSRTPQHIVEAAIKALRDGHHGYTPATGLLATREAVVRRTLTTTGVEVSPENVMILPGGKPTMFAAIIMFGEPGAEILYPDPGFPDLSLDDRVHRGNAHSGADARSERLCLLCGRDTVADHAEAQGC